MFPSDRRPGQPLEDIKNAWPTIMKRARIKDSRPHDLRHSYATILASANLSLPIIGKLLGHTQARTTEKYAHIPDDPLRQAAEKIVGAIVKAGKASDNVVSLKGGRGS